MIAPNRLADERLEGCAICIYIMEARPRAKPTWLWLRDISDKNELLM